MSVIKLSKRMQAVADFADGECVADIGCDHAFVSIYMIESGRTRRVIAMDINSGPVKIAMENVAAYGLGGCIDVRLSDGFEKLNAKEADCAIIAGMGGQLMVDILNAGSVHTDNGIHLVLQPQSEPDKVREYLYNAGYGIADEVMLIEDDKYYTVMKAVPAVEAHNVEKPYNEAEYLYGRLLLDKRDAVLRSYLLANRQKNIELMAKLEHIHTESSCDRIKLLKKDNDLICRALEYYG